VVLLLVLVVIVLTTTSVYAIAVSTLRDVHSVRHRSERARAELLARAGLALAERALADDATADQTQGTLEALYETQTDSWRMLASAPIELGLGGEIVIQIHDSGSRINLNGLVDVAGVPHAESREYLEAVLERVIDDMPGRAEEKLYDPDELADAILDWLDTDDQTRLGDREQDSYARPDRSARPPNRPLIALGELAAIPDMDDDLLDALDFYFTTLPLFPAPDRIGVNPNTAPAHVLATIYQGDSSGRALLGREGNDREVWNVLRARKEGRTFCPSEEADRCVTFQSEVGDEGTVFPPLQFQSDIFEIVSEGRFAATEGAPPARVRIRAIVDRSDPYAIETLFYQMN
jgi:type II secretory pathway component PulK